jgi:hypothetical protein
MAISSSDLKFVASERMIDNLSAVAGVGGGGSMSQTIIVDGTENNVFPDVMPGDRTAGRQQLREVYPIVLSGDNDTLYNAAVGVAERPSDPNVEVCALTIPAGNLSSQAAAALGTRWTAGTTEAFNFGPPSGGNAVDVNGGLPVPAVGDLVRLRGYQATAVPQWAEYGLRIVTGVAGDIVTVDGGTFLPDAVYLYLVENAGAGTRVSALSLLTDGVSAAADEIEVDALWATVQQPGASTLDTLGEPSGRSGTLPLYLPGDQLLIEHESTPTTREVVVVEHVNYATATVKLTTGLANAYTTGSKVTRLVPLGALQARANNVFAQQTWTRTWSDAAIGSSISSRYSGSIPMVNEGGVTDRWACVFTSATAYNLISERLGQIGSGTIGADYTPLNPLTSQPYFTLQAAGWGTGWLPGNALRFNTVAASAPVWLNRLTKPSEAGGTDQVALFMRGDVDA